MAAKKKELFIDVELDFAEKSLKQWRDYIEANPIHEIKDRWGQKEMPKGGQTWVVTATAEQQIKCVQDTLTKYLQLVETVNKLREIEENKIQARGKGEIKGQAAAWIANRNG